MILKARWIVPISGPPIENGWIEIDDGMIVGVGTGATSKGAASGAPTDLGDCALFPGLINMHCHLEFKRGQHPSASFAGWVRSVGNGQGNLAPTVQKNINRLLETGTTTIVNHVTNVGAPLAAPYQKHSPHLIHILEIVGSSLGRATESYRQACETKKNFIDEDMHISPTSLYAVHPTMWEQFIEQLGLPNTGAHDVGATGRSPLLSVHYKESAEEDKLYKDGVSPLSALVRERGGKVWLTEPLAWLAQKGLLRPRTLLIHGNYMTDREIRSLSGTGTGLVHCPGSHAYFGHQRFPLDILMEHKVPVALGTDSLASNEDLNMLREMRLFQEAYPELSAEQIVKMCTLDAAKILGMEEKIGSLKNGKNANMIAVPMSDDDPFQSLLMAETTSMNMIAGKLAHIADS